MFYSSDDKLCPTELARQLTYFALGEDTTPDKFCENAFIIEGIIIMLETKAQNDFEAYYRKV